MPASRNLVLRTLLVTAVAVAGLVGFGPARTGSPPGQALAAPADAPSGISVQGVGRITLAPDLATLSLSVEQTATTARAAQDAASRAMTRVIAAVKGEGVADSDLTSQWLSLQPRYEATTGTTGSPRITGYVARPALQVKVHRTGTVGDVIDAAIGAGANRLDGATFGLADPTAATAQARRAAVADAKARAAALAAAAGVTLGAPTAISEVSAPTPVPLPYDARSGAVAPDAAVATPVQPGTAEVTVTVSVTFAIGG